MCEPTWILASFQSTSDPFIQILPVPGKAICLLLSNDLTRRRGAARMSALHFAAEGAFRGAGLQRLAAVPAEARLRRFAGAQAGVDFGDVCLAVRANRARPARASHTAARP